MRATRIVVRSAVAAACGLSLLLIAGCPKHENFPTELDLVEAPKPSDFVITSLGLNLTTGKYDYDLGWSISDPTHVSGYRLYLVIPGFAPEFLADITTGTSYQFALSSNAEGLQFGLSSVSTGLVEGAMVVATVPPIQSP